MSHEWTNKIEIRHKQSREVLVDHDTWISDPYPRRSAVEAAISAGRSQLIGADLACANLEGLVAPYANLREARLREAVLTGARLSHADLRNADLRNADLRNADLRDADLRNADLSEVNLSGACLIRADLRYTILERARLPRADLSYADLRHANLEKAMLHEATLDQATLSYANLSLAQLDGATLWHATADDATFSLTSIIGVSLINTSLLGVNLSVANLTYKSLSEARLRQDPRVTSADAERTLSMRLEQRAAWWRTQYPDVSPVPGLVDRTIEMLLQDADQHFPEFVTNLAAPPLVDAVLKAAGLEGQRRNQIPDLVDHARKILRVTIGVVPHLWHRPERAFAAMIQIRGLTSSAIEEITKAPQRAISE